MMDTQQNGAFIFETETAVNLTLDGIVTINRIDAEVVKFHTCLLLVSQGLERLMKLVIIVGEFEQNSDSPPQTDVAGFKHNLIKLADAVVSFAEQIDYQESRPASKEDMDFIRNDERLRKLLEILTDFGKRGRYYDLDTLLMNPKVSMRLDPATEFENFMDDIYRKNQGSQENISVPDYSMAKAEITEILQRFTRALCRMFIWGPLGATGRLVSPTVGPFWKLRDEDLSTPAKYLFKSVVEC